MDNRLAQISRRVTTKYREVTGDPFNAAMDDLDYLLCVMDAQTANYNAGSRSEGDSEYIRR